MMEEKEKMQWTPEQRRVIDTRGQNILVSAAAGSGKTAVLVARILAIVTDLEHPVDIDRLLVVTFTNAAASEMRQRIRDALEERAEAEPDNEHLQRQLVLIHNAKITTIHSFCLQVLRNHFHTIGLDPSFRVVDEGEMLLMKQDMLEETLEEAYAEYARIRTEHTAGSGSGAAPLADTDRSGAASAEREERHLTNAESAQGAGMDQQAASGQKEEFCAFLERFATGKDDRAVFDAVLSLYHFSLGQPWPEEWLEQCCAAYAPQEGSPDWLSYAVQDTHRMLRDLEEQLHLALALAQQADGPYPYLPALQADSEMIAKLQRAGSYEALAGAFSEAGTHKALGRKSDPLISEEKKQRVKELRDGVKSELAAIRRRYFYDRPEVLRSEFLESGVTVRELVRLTERFAKKYRAKKAEKNLLDFSDLEHLALQVLVNRSGGTSEPTAAAQEYAEQFEEILIDEYQDSNLVQEILLNSVSGRGRREPNLFMVGDVKQSIYRFRLARPELFLEKYHSYRQGDAQSCRIDLHRNFRSRAQVLGSVNYIFRQIMTEHPGGIVYDEDAWLYPGASFAPDGREGERATELWLTEADTGDRRRAEARMVGRRILELVGKTQVWDKEQGGSRPARYRDIVILLRTVSGWSEEFQEVLTEMGIPCFTGSRNGYFSAVEVRTVLAYLQVLDNPVQDIPLAAVLRSPIGGFADGELAQIRSASASAQFYDCCVEYCAQGSDVLLRGRLESFFDRLRRFRERAAYTPVHLLLWEILDETGYGEYAASLPAGNQRRANLNMLIEKAIAYETTSYRGLYHFVRYIENLKKYEVDYGEANIGAEADDTVRIMSIHKSKGLEFPIVFVSGTGKQFNEADSRSRVVLHPDLGIGCDFVDPVLRLRRPNLLKKIIQKRSAAENLGEELRVLYVAMTRAKEKLILTGCTADLEKQIALAGAARQSAETELPYARLIGASCYLDWLLPAMLRHPSADPYLAKDGSLRKAEPPAEEDGSIPKAELPVEKDGSLRKAEVSVPERTAGQNQNSSPGTEALNTEYVFCFVGKEALNLAELRAGLKDGARLRELALESVGRSEDPQLRTRLSQIFALEYPYQDRQEIVGKISVSELKKLSQAAETEEAQMLYESGPVEPVIPQFRREEGPVRGAARGTIYHILMENLDFGRKDALEIQLEEWIRCGKMTPEEAASVRRSDIRRFLASDTGRRMERAFLAGQLHREQPFVLGVPAHTIRSEWSAEEMVLVQGIIDAWMVEEDGSVTVVDYKTDRAADMQELVQKYHAQIEAYAEALRRLTGRTVKRKLLYSFWLGEEIAL